MTGQSGLVALDVTWLKIAAYSVVTTICTVITIYTVYTDTCQHETIHSSLYFLQLNAHSPQTTLHVCNQITSTRSDLSIVHFYHCIIICSTLITSPPLTGPQLNRTSSRTWLLGTAPHQVSSRPIFSAHAPVNNPVPNAGIKSCQMLCANS